MPDQDSNFEKRYVNALGKISSLQQRLNTAELDNSRIYDNGVANGRHQAHTEMAKHLERAYNAATTDGGWSREGHLLYRLIQQVRDKIMEERTRDATDTG